MIASGSMLPVLKCRKTNSQRRWFVEFIGAGEGIRILDPLNLCFKGSQNLEKCIAGTLQI